jgi:hypothetical protein
VAPLTLFANCSNGKKNSANSIDSENWYTTRDPASTRLGHQQRDFKLNQNLSVTPPLLRSLNRSRYVKRENRNVERVKLATWSERDLGPRQKSGRS